MICLFIFAILAGLKLLGIIAWAWWVCFAIPGFIASVSIAWRCIGDNDFLGFLIWDDISDSFFKALSEHNWIEDIDFDHHDD